MSICSCPTCLGKSVTKTPDPELDYCIDCRKIYRVRISPTKQSERINSTVLYTDPNPICDRCKNPKSAHYIQSLDLVCPRSSKDEEKEYTYPTFRRPVFDMPRIGIAPHPKIPLGTYRHNKTGNLYVVIGGVNDSTGCNDVEVLYISVKTGFCSMRTIDDFLDSPEGISRYTYISAEGKDEAN